MIDIDKEMELIAKITSGPWATDGQQDYVGRCTVFGPDGDAVAEVWGNIANDPDPSLATDNAEFIAHAREYCPESLKRMKRARELFAKIVAHHDRITIPYDGIPGWAELRCKAEDVNELRKLFGLE